MKKQLLIRPWIWVLPLMLLFLTACNGPTEKLWLNAPGWSRAKLVGLTWSADPAPFVLDEAENIYFFLLEQEGEIIRPQVIAWDRQAQPLWVQTMEAPLRRPDNPEMLWDGRFLHLFWTDENKLYTLKLDQNGRLQSELRLLSGDQHVDSYDVAVDNQGNLAVWYAGPRRTPGLYALQLTDAAIEASLIDEEGVRPEIQYDDQGTLHAVWPHYGSGSGRFSFYYADYPEAVYEPGRETEFFEAGISVSSVLKGPWFGQAEDGVYVFWSIEVRTGMSAGAIVTSYIHFPIGTPVATMPQEVRVPIAYDLPYEELSAELETGSRVSLLDGSLGRSSPPTDITINPAIEGEMVAAVRYEANYRWNKRADQVGVIYLRDGTVTEFQLLSFTAGDSTSPQVLSNQNQLYMTWLEQVGSEGFQVYLATTAPHLEEVLGSITIGDVGNLTAETVFGLLTGFVLGPIAALLWLVVPMLFIAVTGFVRRDETSLSDPRSALSLILTVAIFLFIKVSSIPSMLEYVPFSAWVPLPDWLYLPLQYGVPLVITAFSLWTAWYFTFRRQSHSLLNFMLIFGSLDGALTMAVYGVLFYSAF